MDRGENIDNLVMKSEDLRLQSKTYASVSNGYKNPCFIPVVKNLKSKTFCITIKVNLVFFV